MRKNGICGLVIAAIAAGLTIGLACSKQDSTSSGGGEKTIRILWAEWKPADALQELGKEYEAATGVPVVVVKKSWDGDFLNTALNEFRNKGDKYDIIIGDSQWVGMGVAGGHYVELTEWIPQNIK